MAHRQSNHVQQQEHDNRLSKVSGADSSTVDPKPQTLSPRPLPCLDVIIRSLAQLLKHVSTRIVMRSYVGVEGYRAFILGATPNPKHPKPGTAWTSSLGTTSRLGGSEFRPLRGGRFKIT